MTEQDILDRIDDVTRPVCGWCTTPLDPDGPSLDFCDDEHQLLWTTRRGESIVGYREAGMGFMDWEVEGDPLRLGGVNPIDLAATVIRARRVNDQVRASFEALTRGVNEAAAAIRPGLVDAAAALAHFSRTSQAAAAASSHQASGLFQIWIQSMAGARPSITWVDETQEWTAGRIADLFEVPREFVGERSPEPAAPVDPMQAALEARRNRNTGPCRRSRAPKNIGWGRGRP